MADGDAGNPNSEDDFVYMMLQMQVRRKLIHLRINQECSIADLSVRTGISAADLIKMETGEMPVSVEDAGKIMDAFDYFAFENKVLSTSERLN